MSVEDNVKTGMENQFSYGMWSGIFRAPKYWKQEKVAHERALELLSIFNMADMADMKAGSLPYGAQRRLEIVRALATNNDTFKAVLGRLKFWGKKKKEVV